MRTPNRWNHPSFTRPRRGAGMTECIIVVGLISLALVTSVKVLGWRIEESYFAALIHVLEVEEKMDSDQRAPEENS